MKTRAHVQDDFQYGGVRVLWGQESREHGTEAIGWPDGGHVPRVGAEGDDALAVPSVLRWERLAPEVQGQGVTTWDRGLVLGDPEARALLDALLKHYGIPQAQDAAARAAGSYQEGRVEVLREALEVERKRVDLALDRQAFPLRVVGGDGEAEKPQYVPPRQPD